MNGYNQSSGCGTLLPTLAALTLPAQGLAGSRPAPRGVPGRRPRAGTGARLGAVIAAFRRRQEQARLRRALERLDDHLLRDIGVSRAEVNAGLLPPFTRPEEPELRTLGRQLAARW